MKYALLDVGSNTIRLMLYQPREHGLDPIFESKENARLISFVRDNRMEQPGIDKLIETVTRMKQEAQSQGADQLFCFATASLRGLDNQREVLDAVKNTGVPLQAVSAQEEALCDFEGLRAAAGRPDFIGCDLGGGSAQIFSAKSGEPDWWVSLPVGCLKMANAYVRGFLPTDQEESMLRNAVRQELLGQPALFENRYGTLYLTGGSARAAQRLVQELLGLREDVMPQLRLREVIRRLRQEENARELLSRYVPGREEIIVPGMMVLDEISHAAGVSYLSVEEYGVREGYLLRHVLKGE